MNVLSLFDGIACGKVALDRAGIKYNNYFASEIDKYAIKIAMKNHPDIIQLGDVREVKGENLPKIDLLMGGSPCQGFSFAGKQLNFGDPRSQLFFEYVRILKEIKETNPDVIFLLENVKMKKEYQDIISNLLGVEPVEINSALVSAQNRKRLYWTNIHDLTQPEDKNIFLKDVVFKDALFCGRLVGRRLDKNGIRKDYSNIPIQQRFEMRIGGKSGAITTVQKDNMVLRDVALYHFPHGFTKGGIREYKKSPTITTQFHNNYFSIDLKKLLLSNKAIEYMNRNVSGGRNHWDFKHHSEVSNPKSAAVVANFFKGVPYNVLKDWNCIRKFDPIECERLQTLPDNYTEGVSNTQRYKALGNGWTVDVIKHIFSFI